MKLFAAIDAISIPKGYSSVARGCDSYPGTPIGGGEPTPKGLRNPFRVGDARGQPSRGSSATPGFDSKAPWALGDRLWTVCANVLLLMVFAVIGLHAAEPVSLFDGKTHEGWTRYGGNHDYRVEDGVIIGKLVAGEASSYLCTDKQFGDFELLFEVKYLVGSVNSGCQIRSLIRQEDGEKNFMKKGAEPF